MLWVCVDIQHRCVCVCLLGGSPLEAVKSMATVKLIWVLRRQKQRGDHESTIMCLFFFFYCFLCAISVHINVYVCVWMMKWEEFLEGGQQCFVLWSGLSLSLSLYGEHTDIRRNCTSEKRMCHPDSWSSPPFSSPRWSIDALVGRGRGVGWNAESVDQLANIFAVLCVDQIESQ